MSLTPEEEEELKQLTARYGSVIGDSSEDKEIVDLGSKYPGFADSLYESSPEQPVQEQPEEEPPSFLTKAKHVTKAFGKVGFDLLDLPNTVTTAARAPIEWAADKVGIELPNIEGSLSPLFGTFPKLSEMPGLKQAKEALASREFDREAAPVADTLRTGAEWGAAGPYNFFKKAATRPDLMMAGGAMLGEAATDYFGADSDIGELVGGITGLLAGIKRSGGVLADEKAIKFIRAHADDADAAIKNIEEAVKKGEKGSLAQLSGDQGLYNIDAGVRVDKTTGNTLDDINIQRQEQIAEEMRTPFGVESKVPAIEAAKARIAGRNSSITAGKNSIQDAIDDTYGKLQEGITTQSNAASRATSQADEAASLADDVVTSSKLPLATLKRPAQTSADMKSVYSDEINRFETEEIQPLWERFKAQPDVDIKPIHKAANAALNEMSAVELTALSKKYGSVITPWNIKKIKNPDTGVMEYPPISGSDVQSLLRNMREAFNVPDPRDFLGPERSLKKLYERIESDFAKTNDVFREAKAKTKEKYDRFYPEKMDKAQKIPPERFAGKLGQADEAGAETARLAETANIPGLPGARLEHMKAVAEREGGVTDQFITKYKESIDSLPAESRKQFYDLAEANKASDVAQKEAVKLTRANEVAQTKAATETRVLDRALDAEKAKVSTRAERLNRSVDAGIVGKYAKSPEKTVQALLKDPDSAGKLKRLYEGMDSLSAGESFKGHLRDKLSEMLVSTSKGSNKITSKSAENTKKLVNNLVDGGVLSRTEADYIKDVLSKVGTDEKLRLRAIEQHMLRAGNEWENLLASGASATVLSGMPGTQSLMVGGALRRAIRRMIDIAGSGRTKPQVVHSLESFMLNPSAYIDAASGTKTAKEATMSILTRLVGASQAAAILDEEQQ